MEIIQREKILGDKKLHPSLISRVVSSSMLLVQRHTALTLPSIMSLGFSSMGQEEILRKKLIFERFPKRGRVDPCHVISMFVGHFHHHHNQNYQYYHIYHFHHHHYWYLVLLNVFDVQKRTTLPELGPGLKVVWACIAYYSMKPVFPKLNGNVWIVSQTIIGFAVHFCSGFNCNFYLSVPQYFNSNICTPILWLY